MKAEDVLELLRVLDDHEVGYWLDGGWGVDCLLGEQTRDHSDLDLVLDRRDLDRTRALLESRGFEVIRDWLPSTIAFRDQQGREVDLHPVDLTADGGGDQALLDGGTWHYAPPVSGSIGGRPVPCASAEDQLLMHQGYEPRPVDVEDVGRLVDRFTLPAPASFGARHPAWNVRPATEADLDELVSVQEEASVVALAHVFPQDRYPFPRDAVRDRWRGELRDPGTAVYVARDEEARVIGFAARRDDEVLHFGTAVATWGTGAASTLHDALLATFPAELPRLWLRVFVDNHRARRFWEKHGWTSTDRRSRSPFPPHPALVEYELLRPRA